jgi:hypothetical protein
METADFSKTLVFGFTKKTTSYRIEKMYLLYIFPLEPHTLITSLF